MSAKHVLVCWECGKEHDCVPLSQRPYLCDCGGYVVSPSGKVMLKRLDESSATCLCKQCGRPGRIENNQTYCDACGPGAELVAAPDEETAYGNDCRGGNWMRWWRRRMEDGMIGLVYEYQCREHGTSNPIVIFRNLRYLHLCPKCKREMKKVYVKTVTVDPRDLGRDEDDQHGGDGRCGV